MQEQHTTTNNLVELSTRKDPEADIAAFAQHISAGLSLEQKQLSSRYFYDANGSRLFQDIMHMPEYYLTSSEFELLTAHQQHIASAFAADGYFHLIDMGAGDALKTRIILKQLQEQQADFDFVPVDISGAAMQELTKDLQQQLPGLQTQAVVGEYFTALEWLQKNKPGRKVVLFLGSNIGNFEPDDQLVFLKNIRDQLQPGDLFYMGLDLRKDPDVILEAYNDKAGITAAFNLNLLHRINRELGGDFDVTQFRHHALYNPLEGAMKSFIVSKKEQDVQIAKTGKTFHFEAWEAIHTESSYKFTLAQAEALGKQTGFTLKNVFTDEKAYFADVLFTVN